MILGTKRTLKIEWLIETQEAFDDLEKYLQPPPLPT